MNSGTQFFLRAAFSLPLTWLVVLLLTATAVTFGTWFQPSSTVLILLAAVCAALLALWLWLLAKDVNFQRRFHILGSGIRDEQLVRLYRLEGELRSAGAGAGAEHCADQLRKLRDQFDALSRLLIRRVHHGELAYGRHLAETESLMLRALNTTEAALRTLRDAAPASDNQVTPSPVTDELHAETSRTLTLFDELITLLRHTSLAVPYSEIASALRPLTQLSRPQRSLGQSATDTPL